ncbi:MAG: flagellar hook-basal body complex protein FliE [Pikeienuella sp.]
MDIDTSFAARLYDTARKLGEPGLSGDTPVAGTSFAETLARAAQEIDETLRRGEQAADAAASGRGDVQSVVEALTATELALQTAVTVRDRVVEAYKEILRMPV